MTEAEFPSVFVSHGAPTLVLTACPARDFLAGLGQTLGRPRAIVVVSAHWETGTPEVGGSIRPETLHDFHGFPDPLYRLRYPAPGSREVAERVAGLVGAAGLDGTVVDRGLDHGAWVPLMLMYAEADVPVVPLSIQPARGPGAQLALGRALEPLRPDGILVLASGGAVHNLAHFRPGSATVPDWAHRFDDWLADVVADGDADALVDYRALSPEGALAHPRDEHLLPLMVAMGAGGIGARGRPLYRGFMDGALGMAAYAFDRA